MKIVNRRRMNDEGSHNIWRSYSDMMSGLLLLFVLIMAVCLMQAQKNYNDRLAEQASRLRTQDELDRTQQELSQRESEVEAQSMTLTDLQTALETQAKALSTKESELDEAQLTLSDAQQTLAEQQKQLEDQQALLSEQQNMLTDQQTRLTHQESELELRDAALISSQEKLDEQTQLMNEQQKKIDQIIGVKADLIEALNQEFSENQINVNIDEQTGAIVLDSNVLFALREWELTEEGEEVLYQILPVYCQVLLSDEYKDYVAEIIIDGYTDSQGDYLSNGALHTFEHLFATYARNSSFSDNVIYVGPMGCRTGFYFLLRDSVAAADALKLVEDSFRFIAVFSGEIPGSKRNECGNYREHDLAGAKAVAEDMLSVLKNWTVSKMTYEA